MMDKPGMFSAEEIHATEIRRWRRSLIDEVIRVLFIIGVPTLLISFYYAWIDGTPGVIPVYVASFVLLALVRFWEGAPYLLKVGLLLAMVFGLGFISLLRAGLGGDGRLFLLVLPFITLTFLGQRAALGGLLVSVLTLVILGTLFSTGVLSVPPEVEVMSAKPWAWLDHGISWLMLSLFLVASQRYLLPRFAEALLESREMARELDVRRREAEEDAVREQRYADRLRWAVSLGSEITSLRRRDQLAQRLVREIARTFDVYQVSLYLVSRQRDALTLAATAGSLGDALPPEVRRIPLGSRALPSRVVQMGQEQVALLSPGESPRYPLSRVELCIPLVVVGEVLGVLDVHGAGEVFSEDDRQLFRIVVGYATAALDMLRHLEDAETRMREMRDLYAQYTLSSWQTLLESEQVQAYTQGAVPPEDVVAVLAEQAMQDQAPRSVTMDGDAGYLLVVPLVARGVALGYLAFTRPPAQGDWDDATLELIRVAAERLAVAMDNTRLVIDARRQAQYDEELGHINDIVWSTPNVEVIMDRSVRELGRFLGASEVALYITPETVEGEV
jgi:GAF domain-containing protein